jgi:hypothetical protein
MLKRIGRATSLVPFATTPAALYHYVRASGDFTFYETTDNPVVYRRQTPEQLAASLRFSLVPTLPRRIA